MRPSTVITLFVDDEPELTVITRCGIGTNIRKMRAHVRMYGEMESIIRQHLSGFCPQMGGDTLGAFVNGQSRMIPS